MPRYGWFLLAAISFLVVAGPLASGRLVPPAVGAGAFALGGAIALLSGIGLGAAALYAARRRRAWARPAAIATVIPLLIGLAFVGLILARLGPATRFNDVTTDLNDPPVFVVGPAAGAAYPPAFVAWHRQSYPSLTSVVLREPPDAALERVLRAAGRMPDWEIAHTDRASRTMQAVARTRLFRFEDDIVIRIRESAGQSIVDLRSRSRLGRGDRGANAARIAAFIALLDQK